MMNYRTNVLMKDESMIRFMQDDFGIPCMTLEIQEMFRKSYEECLLDYSDTIARLAFYEFLAYKNSCPYLGISKLDYAKFFYKLGKYRIKREQQIFVLEVKDPNHHYAVGWRPSNYKKAIYLFQKSIKINPKDDNVFYELGNAFLCIGDRRQAIRNYKKCLEINPKHVNAMFELGITLSCRGNDLDAIEEFKKVEKLNLSHPDVFFDWGKVLVKQCLYIDGNDKYCPRMYAAAHSAMQRHHIKLKLKKIFSSIRSWNITQP